MDILEDFQDNFNNNAKIKRFCVTNLQTIKDNSNILKIVSECLAIFPTLIGLKRGWLRSWKAKNPAQQSAYAAGTHDVVAAYHDQFDERIGRNPEHGGTITVRASKAWRSMNFVQTKAGVALM